MSAAGFHTPLEHVQEAEVIPVPDPSPFVRDVAYLMSMMIALPRH
jgi:hypothetical protein